MKKQNRIINILLNPKTILGIIISVGGLYWAFKDFQFQEFKNSLNQVKYFYVFVAMFFLWMSVWFRAFRWKYLFKLDSKPSTNSLYKAEMMGYFGNNVLPVRLGELLRSYLIGNEWKLSTSYVFGTVVLERLLDTLSLAAFAFLLILIYPLEESLRYSILCYSGIFIVVIMTILMILHKAKSIETNNKILSSLKQMMDGLLSINKGSILSVMALSMIIWSIYFLDVYLIQYAFKFNLFFDEILMILVLSSLALSIPSAPGMIGTYHAAVIYAVVTILGKNQIEGEAFAIIMHAYGYILFTVLGAYYFMKNQFHKHAVRTVMDIDVSRDD